MSIIRNSIRKRSINWVVTFILLMSGFVLLAGYQASASQTVGHGNAQLGSLPGAAAEPEQHSLPQKAVEIARPFGFPITNSMVVTWIVALGLIIFARLTTREMKQVPGGAQNLLEWLVGGLYGF
ncbi:MAG: atpB, partial [Acidobacteria bacterium]|nr:atpB [Acidobacteriota bacterium]